MYTREAQTAIMSLIFRSGHGAPDPHQTSSEGNIVAEIIRIEDVARYDGQEVTLRGWVYDRTDKGKLRFIQLRDGTGIIQCVAFKRDMDEEQFAEAGKLTQESSVMITGTVRSDERAPGIPGGFELGVKSLSVFHIAEDYPITPKEHGTEFLM